MTTSYSGTIEATASSSAISLLAGLSDIDANLNSVVAAGSGPATGGQFLPQEGNAVGGDDYPVGAPDGIYTAGEDNYGFVFEASSTTYFAVDDFGPGEARDAILLKNRAFAFQFQLSQNVCLHCHFSSISWLSLFFDLDSP